MNIIEKYNPFFKLATRNPSARVTSETFISDSMYFILSLVMKILNSGMINLAAVS